MIAAYRERVKNEGANPYLVTIAVSLATFMEVLDTTITNVSLSHIAGELGASRDESTWVLTSYLVANAIILPLSGWLASVIGRKRFFMMCIIGFTAASFACGAATSMPMLVVFRLLQGLAGGGLQPVQQSIVMDTFPPEKRGTGFALTGITMIVAPVLGPTLGGFITDSYSWRWVFYLNIPIGILALLLVGLLVHDPEHAKAKKASHIDYIGLALVALGVGALQIMLDKGQQEDWFDSHFIRMFAILSFTSLAAAVYWLFHQKDPVVDIRLLGMRSFSVACLSMFAVGFALYGSSALLPMVTEGYFGYDALLAGLVLSPGAVILIFLMPISGKLVAKVQPKYMMTIGFTMVAVGMWVTSHITPDVDYKTFVLMRLVQVIGLPFLFIPASAMAFGDIPKEKSGKASAIFSLSRNLGGSVGIAAIASYVAHSQQLHQSRLVEHLTPSSPIYRDMLQHTVDVMMAHGTPHARAMMEATHHIYNDVQHQAGVLAYADAFLILSYALGALAITVLLLMPKLKRQKQGVDAGLAH